MIKNVGFFSHQEHKVVMEDKHLLNILNIFCLQMLIFNRLVIIYCPD